MARLGFGLQDRRFQACVLFFSCAVELRSCTCSRRRRLDEELGESAVKLNAEVDRGV